MIRAFLCSGYYREHVPNKSLETCGTALGLQTLIASVKRVKIYPRLTHLYTECLHSYPLPHMYLSM
jgi:hypothetical protein